MYGKTIRMLLSNYLSIKTSKLIRKYNNCNIYALNIRSPKHMKYMFSSVQLFSHVRLFATP